MLIAPAIRVSKIKEFYLPAVYDPFVLTEEERSRFLAALGDGFGAGIYDGHTVEVALPAKVDAGLLRHSAFFQSDEKTDEFWAETDETGEPGHFRLSPINFKFESAQSYFYEQKLAYLDHVVSSDEFSEFLVSADKIDEDELWLETLYQLALYRPYSKPWYEYHINRGIDFVTMSLLPSEILASLRVLDFENFVGETALVAEEAVKLGRLIEQYYWKFFIEKSAIRGEKSSEGAKFGGNIKASKQKRVHERWQLAAVAVWQENPTRSKMTVAKIVKQRLKLGLSAKHISRVLTRP